MMENNFLTFINNDITNKKEILNSLPTKTKSNKKKINKLIEEYKEKYHEYRNTTRNYLLAKAKSFTINEIKPKNNLSEKLENLEYVKFLLNPINSYFEKMSFDSLFYQLNNYDNIDFKKLNEIINSLIDKFQIAGISLVSEDFNYTTYVNDYMKVFLQKRVNVDTDAYEELNRTFEEIYWVNPSIIEQIELNFRKLIKAHAKKFEMYIEKLKEDALNKNNIKNYDDCLLKLSELRKEIYLDNEETLTDIIDKAKNREIDISHYLEGSKVRAQAFDSLVPPNANFEDVIDSLEKLLQNINEYNDYIFFSPVFIKFKEEYESLLNMKEDIKLESLVDEINKKESDLDRINKRIDNKYLNKISILNDNKKLKLKANLKAKELYDLYKKLDFLKFKYKVKKLISSTMTVSDVLHLYYSYDYFKKKMIEDAFQISDYDEVIKLSEKFDLFAMNPLNIICNGVPIFQDYDIAKIIVNRYRLENINVTIDDLNPDNLDQIKNKINLILRINKINKCNISVEKIWFIVEVDKIISKENVSSEF